MKRIVKAVCALAVAAAIACAVLYWMRPTWPVFPESKTMEPQVVTQVETRDYGHRTGDLVQVEVFIKQPPGIEVYPETFTVGGDFEAPEKKPAVSKKELDDGSVLYRVCLQVQSFKVQRKQVMKATVGWKNAEGRLDFNLPDTEVYTSFTYDGMRKQIKEGPDPRVSIYWYAGRFVVPLAVSSLIFLFLVARAVLRYLASRPKPVVDKARLRALELIERVKARTSTKAEHLELDGLIRDHNKIGPVPAHELANGMISPDLLCFLTLNATATYAETTLGEEDNTRLHRAATRVLNVW